VREVDRELLRHFGLCGRWRWLEPGERIQAGDRHDFGRPTDTQLRRSAREMLREPLPDEVGYVVMGDEEFDVMRRLPEEQQGRAS
jgi:hypothetical protein